MGRIVWTGNDYKQWQIKTYTASILADCKDYFNDGGPGEWVGVNCASEDVRDAVRENINGKVICDGRAVIEVVAVWDNKMTIKLKEVNIDVKEEDASGS